MVDGAGCLKKRHHKVLCSFCLVSPVTNKLEGWYIFLLKVRIQSSVWSTKTFMYNISQPRVKQADFQEFKVINNLEIFYCQNSCIISSYEHLGWDIISHCKGDILRHKLSSNSFLQNIRVPKYKQNSMGHHIISRH